MLPQFSHAARPILVGTSGYSYAEWAEAGFYPPGTKAGEMLPLYARRFGITELNFTWYQLPKPQAIERMARLAPPAFRFTAKLTRTLTHEVDPGQWRGQAALYREGIAPLVQSGQLLALLLQFPPGFARDPAGRRYLAELLDALQGLPLAVEFRHATWAADRVFAELERRRAALVGGGRPGAARPLPEARRRHQPRSLLRPAPRPQRAGVALGQHAEAVRLRLPRR
jgi:uncharacterized protein YecE (DUF72 family)